MFEAEVREHLTRDIIPFWQRLRDEEQGGFYGYVGYDLTVGKRAVKGCILNSRILWFFSNAYLLLGDRELLADAEHAYRFLRERFVDKENGGVYWSVTWDGKPEDTTKHTYNQAFAIYALSSYYDASGDEGALALALELYRLVEEKCRDEYGYMEAFNARFEPAENDRLSENGVMAEKTMNTLLHVFEAYTELYRVCRQKGVQTSVKEITKLESTSLSDFKLHTRIVSAAAGGMTGSVQKTVADNLRCMLDLIGEKVYNREKGRQEVFFDRKWNSLLDLYSYGHDIETAWLVDRGLEILEDAAYAEKLSPITGTLTKHIYERAYSRHFLANEAENGIVDTTRVWWVQAEAVVGFLNGYQKNPEHREYLEAAEDIWNYIRDHLVDKRSGSEWYWALREDGTPIEKPIVEPWKCPYHNGRMCFEVIRRMRDVT